MLHLFTVQQEQLAYDTETQALLLLSPLAAACLGAYQATGGSRPDQKVLEALSTELQAPLTEVIDCCADIDAMVAEGSLFAPPIAVTQDQLYPDEPKIKSMCLHICHDCNLRCKYCFADAGAYHMGRRSMLSAETGRKAIDFLIKASGNRRHLDIDFFGGEPLMNWPVVKELVAYCEEQGPLHGKELRLTMTTNAMLLDKDKQAFINEHFKNVVLSMDGRPEIQNMMRPTAGKGGSYDIVMKNIKSFVALRGDGEYYVRGTFTGMNPAFSADVLHMAEAGLPQLSMEPVVAKPGAGYEIKDSDLPLIKEEYETLAVEMLKRDRTPDAFNFFHFNIDLSGGPCLFKRLKGCGVGTEYCAVTPEGDIYPCHQFVGEKEFIMGNVHAEPIVLKLPHGGEFNALILPDKEPCQNCWARYYCSGGCAANAWHATGHLNGIYEQACELIKKRLECALWLAAKQLERDEQLAAEGSAATSDNSEQSA